MKSKLSIDTRVTKGLNEDRGDATWQQERGARYGNARKARSRMKVLKRRLERRKKEDFLKDIE